MYVLSDNVHIIVTINIRAKKWHTMAIVHFEKCRFVYLIFIQSNLARNVKKAGVAFLDLLLKWNWNGCITILETI